DGLQSRIELALVWSRATPHQRQLSAGQQRVDVVAREAEQARRMADECGGLPGQPPSQELAFVQRNFGGRALAKPAKQDRIVFGHRRCTIDKYQCAQPETQGLLRLVRVRRPPVSRIHSARRLMREPTLSPKLQQVPFDEVQSKRRLDEV